MEFDDLKAKIQTLCARVWGSRIMWPEVDRWLGNFTGALASPEKERLHALFLATHVMFFNLTLVREMLRSVYRESVRYPIVKKLRETNQHTLDASFLNARFELELSRTRFLGIGNPSESGAHLLYYFRQVNELAKDLFIDSGQILNIETTSSGGSTVSLAEPDVKRFIFIDDLLGSGSQLGKYLPTKLAEVRKWAPDVELHYVVLFGMKAGLDRARKADLFGANVSCLFELDDTFKAFDPSARCFKGDCGAIDRSFAEELSKYYGAKLVPNHPLGYENGQLMLAFVHNTPDNTLPIIWFDAPQKVSWVPLFERYDKKY